MEYTFELLPKQSVAWDYLEDSTTTELGYGGGAGGGKTDLGCKLATVISLEFPGSAGAIGRNTLVDLKKSTLVSLFEEFARQDLVSGVDYEYNDKMSWIQFTNGSVIYLVELAHRPRDPLYTNLGGLQLTWSWIDESAEVSAKARDILFSRTGRRNYNPLWVKRLKVHFGQFDEINKVWILKPFLLETFNPAKGHVYKRFWKPFKEAKMPEHMKFIRALPKDNPYLPQIYLDNLAKQDKVTRERLLFGNFDYDDDPTKIFEYDKICDLFTNRFVKSGEKFLTGDIASKGKDKTVLKVWDGWRVIKTYIELVTDQRLLQKKILALQREYEIPTSNMILDYDGVGVGIVDNLQCKGFQANSAPVYDSWDENSEMRAKQYINLRSQCYFELAKIINGNQMYIDLSNVEISGDISDLNVREMLVEELDAIKQINDGKEQKKRIIPKGGNADKTSSETIKTLLGRSPDFADAIMMRSYFDLLTQPDYKSMFYTP